MSPLVWLIGAVVIAVVAGVLAGVLRPRFRSGIKKGTSGAAAEATLGLDSVYEWSSELKVEVQTQTQPWSFQERGLTARDIRVRGEKVLLVFDSSEGTQVSLVLPDRERQWNKTLPVVGLTKKVQVDLSPDATWVITSEDKQVTLWEVTSDGLTRLTGATTDKPVQEVRFGPTRAEIWTLEDDGTLQSWSANDTVLTPGTWTVQNVKTFDQNGTALCYTESDTLHVYHSQSGQWVEQTTRQMKGSGPVRISADGQYIFCSPHLYRWFKTTWRPQLEVMAPSEGSFRGGFSAAFWVWADAAGCWYWRLERHQRRRLIAAMPEQLWSRDWRFGLSEAPGQHVIWTTTAGLLCRPDVVPNEKRALWQRHYFEV